MRVKSNVPNCFVLLHVFLLQHLALRKEKVAQFGKLNGITDTVNPTSGLSIQMVTNIGFTILINLQCVMQS